MVSGAGFDVAAVRSDLQRFVVKGDLASLNYPAISRALKQGGSATKRLIVDVLRSVAADLGVAVRALSAEHGTPNFIFGGGLMEEAGIADRLIRFTRDETGDACNFRLAKLGNHAGLVGAAAPFLIGGLKANEVVIAVDLGGTKINLAVLGNKAKVMEKVTQIMTCKNMSTNLFAIAHWIREAFLFLPRASLTLKAVGVCSPGIIEDGVVKDAAFFLKKGEPFNFKAELRSRLQKLPLPASAFSVINDAEAATLGEKHFGAGRGLESFILITFGTNLGGGLADASGKVRNIEPGERSFEKGIYGAEETVTAVYRRKKTFEQFVSGTALSRRVAERLG